MADEKPKKLTLKEIAERAAKTQMARDSAPPGSLPPGSLPPGSLSPGIARPSAPPSSRGSAPPSSRGSAPPDSVPPASGPAVPVPVVAVVAAPTTPAAPPGAKVAPVKIEPAKKADQPSSPLPLLVVGIVLVSLLAVGYAVMKRPTGPTVTQTGIAPPPSWTPPPAASSAPSPVPSAAPSAASPGDVDIGSLGAPDTSSKEPKGVRVDPKDPKEPKKVDTAPTAAISAAPIGPAGDLTDEIKKRMGGAGGGKTEATDPGGAPSDAKESKPSAGAVAGSLNAIRGAARACLADTEDVARINVVFGSSGAVQSASVSGAGKAEGCVKAAVLKAKVAPFTDATFSTSFTVRP